MFRQDVTPLAPVADGERGLHVFLLPPPVRDNPSSWYAKAGDCTGGDLLFFLTRSQRALTYSDGGD